MPVYPTSPFTLNTVRSYKNYGLIIQGNTYDPIWSKGWLLSSPNISIQGTTCYIDYSQSFDTSDRIYLKRTFGGLSAGGTFYVSPTEYYDALTDTRTTLGGTCNFNSTLNNGKIIVANVASGLTYTSGYNFYNKENFIKPIQYTFTTSGSTSNNFIINTIPATASLTFKKMGFLGNALGFQEYVDISGATSTNTGRIQIDSVATLKDNQEVLYFTTGVTYQSLVSSSSEVKMYIRGRSFVEQIQEPENINGIYRIHNSSNQIVDCYENQNFYQTYLRKQALGATYTGYWVQCETCPNSIYSQVLSADSVQSNLVFDNNLFLFISQIITNVASTVLPTYTYGVFTQRSLSGSAQSAARLTFSVNVGLKIDLSHASLQGWSFEVFSDSQFTLPLSNNIYFSGQPGYGQAYVLVVSATDVPRTLYCRLVGPQTLTMVINI